MRSHNRAAVAATVALALLSLGGCTAGKEPRAAGPAPVPESSSTSPSTEPRGQKTADVSPTPSPSGTGTVTVPVYFVADTPQGPRLFREFRRVEADNPLEEAAALLTSGDALDPDYRTLFPGGTFSSVEDTGNTIVAQVPDDGWQTPGPGMTEEEARLAVQSLVHTLQGVVQSRDRVLVSLGQSSDWVPLFGVFDSNGFQNAPPLDVLGLVSVTTPEQGATVSGRFTASGVASSFEATVPWEIRRDGEVVEHGFSTAEGWMDRLYPWETEVDVSGLEPGRYEFVALTDDPSGGAEGGGPTEDSKTITVE